jgi:hypothetical protein
LGTVTSADGAASADGDQLGRMEAGGGGAPADRLLAQQLRFETALSDALGMDAGSSTMPATHAGR